MASFNLLNIHTFTTLQSSSLNLAASMILHGLIVVEMEINSNIDSISADGTVEIETRSMETGMNCVVKSKNIKISVVTVKIGSGTTIHADSWNKGTVKIVVNETMTLEPTSRISADKGGSVRLVSKVLEASRTSILSGLGGRTATEAGHQSVSIAIPSGTIEPIIRVQAGTFMVEGTSSTKEVDVIIQKSSTTENLKGFTLKNIRKLELETNAKIEMTEEFKVVQSNLHVMSLLSSSILTGRDLSIGVINLTMASSSSIHTDARGYSTSSESGYGCEYNGQDGWAYRSRWGGAHGGKGGTGRQGSCPSGQTVYGNKDAPTTMGGGAHSVKGGGVIRLDMTGLLTMKSQARISSNGGSAGDRAGGAGGSVWIRSGTVDLAADAVLSVKGGAGSHGRHYENRGYREYNHGGGGGGRMLLEFGAAKDNNILSTTIYVNGGAKGTSYSGASDGIAGSFVGKSKCANENTESCTCGFYSTNPSSFMQQNPSFICAEGTTLLPLTRSRFGNMSCSINTNPICLPCLAGLFATPASTTPLLHQVKCVPCAVGRWSPAKSSTCPRCDPGQEAITPTASCTNCVPGKYSNRTDGCLICLAGTFTPNQASKSCQPCSKGEFNQDKGLVANNHLSCSVCPKGYFNENSAQGECLACPLGYINDNNNTVANLHEKCSQCPEYLICRSTSCRIETKCCSKSTSFTCNKSNHICNFIQFSTSFHGYFIGHVFHLFIWHGCNHWCFDYSSWKSCTEIR